MAVIINASTSTGLVQSADTSGIIQFQSNGSTKATLNSSGFSYPGGVLQVVSTTKTDTFSTASTSYTDITGLSVSITPTSASSKILVIYNVTTASRSSTYSGGIQLFRDSTAIYRGDAAGSRTRASSFWWSDANSYTMWPLNGTFLDSPATTSATTYKLQIFSAYVGDSVYVNRNQIDGDNSVIGRTPSSITVMEIAA